MQKQKEINGLFFPYVDEFEQEQEKLSTSEQITQLKQQLADSDYKAIKYAEGWISEEDYSLIKAERQAIREEINRLESEE